MIQQHIGIGHCLKAVNTANLLMVAAVQAAFSLATTQQGTYIMRFEATEGTSNTSNKTTIYRLIAELTLCPSDKSRAPATIACPAARPSTTVHH